MIKHPALRVRSYADVDPAVKAKIAADLEAWGQLTPFSDLVRDFEIVGSYARGRAELHSDLDINVSFASEADRLLARQRIKNNQTQFRQAIQARNNAIMKHGLRLDIALQDISVKALTCKMCWSVREGRMYGTETRRMDINYETKAVTERVIVRVTQPNFGVAVKDENEPAGVRRFDPSRDTAADYDPWFSDLPKWRTKYGAKFLEFGDTPPTSWMKPNG